MLMQNFGATIKKHYGMLWYFLEWPIATQEYKKIKLVFFWLDCASDLSCFWKTATLGSGDLGSLA